MASDERENDSGIPIKNFDSSAWGMRYFGHYPGPIELFKQHFQPDLAAIYHKSNPPPLPFGFGYRWHPSESSLILATPRGTPAPPASARSGAAPSSSRRVPLANL